ncbi:probable G-protein coupled receptor Mth-like 7 isoform X2 [Drosophila gunungcola]|uniref:Uncharacterized protein n=1 Tax=Drosophila gunungcola TaxID=103775 RepID=A0A9P9YL23_9MUSC|nr:probable G-protein coupled receptor Mth-like 7 isoform X2 [Drosophila gunungcola]KAI8038980.1 hypothetical protein M5D96_007690 [Drosophila gunungcola]
MCWSSEFIVEVISSICLLLTIAVYIYVKKLQNVLGKCLICTLFCLLMLFINLMLLDLLDDIDLFTAFSFYFFGVAYNHWLSAISYHLWKVLTTVRHDEPRHQFLKYSCIVWVTALILSGPGLFLLNLVPSKAFTIWFASIFFAFLISSIFNTIMFILTIVYIWKVKREIKKFPPVEEAMMTTCSNFDTQTYLQCLRIFFIMGVSWVLKTIDYIKIFIDFPTNQPTGLVVKYFHNGFGIFVFVLLVLKRSTLKMLKERIQESRTKKCDRNQGVANI